MTLEDHKGDNPTEKNGLSGAEKPAPKKKKSVRRKTARKKAVAPQSDDAVAIPSKPPKESQDTGPSPDDSGTTRPARPKRATNSRKQGSDTDRRQSDDAIEETPGNRKEASSSVQEPGLDSSSDPESTGTREKPVDASPTRMEHPTGSNRPDGSGPVEGENDNQEDDRPYRGRPSDQDKRRGVSYGFLSAKIRKIMRSLTWAMDDLKETLTLLETAEKEKQLREDELSALKKQLGHLLPGDEPRDSITGGRNQQQPGKRRFRGPRGDRPPLAHNPRHGRPNAGPRPYPQSKGPRPESNSTTRQSTPQEGSAPNQS